MGNNPVNRIDPSGHREVPPCSDLAGGCNITDLLIERDLAKQAYFNQRTDALRCQGGETYYCSYAENHPVETVVSFVVGMVVVSAAGAIVGPPTISELLIASEATVIITTYCAGDCSDESANAYQFANNVVNTVSQVHGNSLSSTRRTYLYELLDKITNKHLKWGITSELNPLDRYTREFMADKVMRLVDYGQRRDIYNIESELILNTLRGPLQFGNH